MSSPLSISFAQSSEALHTGLDWVRFCASQMNRAELFFGHGTENAYDEALMLVSHCLAMPVPWLKDDTAHLLSGQLTKAEKQLVFDMLSARVDDRTPLPYLTQQAWFCNMPFYTDRRVLIPRSPFAELIKDKFSAWLDEPPQLIMDLCTGGGCIAIALAEHFEHAQVDALDISEDALSVAAINIEHYGLEERVFPVHSDVFSGVIGQKYDLIVANPPYVDAEDMQDLPQEFLHEPALALASGEDGLELVDVILREAPSQLTDNGWLFVEVGNSQVHMSQRFPELDVEWVEFNQGGDGVFAVSRNTLVNYWQEKG